jgi:hypothetical protein
MAEPYESMAGPGDELRRPQFLAQVEDLVGLPFFSDPAQERIARLNPNQLEAASPGSAYSRIPAYVAGLRLLHNVRADYGQARGTVPELNETQQDEMRRKYARAIGAIRGELMVLDPGLETPEVRELRLVLHDYREQHPPETFTIPKRPPADILPAQLLPATDVNTLVAMSQGGVLQALRYHGLSAAKLKLPGGAPPQICVDWDFVRSLAGRHGLRPEIAEEIDLTKLPLGPDDTHPDRLAYARQVQARIMDPDKLRNVPELEGVLPPAVKPQVARPYHISRKTLDTLLGGGYHFIDAYCKDHRIELVSMQRQGGHGAGNAKYMTIEEAAAIWGAYEAIPRATESDVTVINASREAGVDKKWFLAELTEAEEAAMKDMRASSPAGRVLAHLPRAVAQQIIERIKTRPLPPHLVPLARLSKRYPVTEGGMHRRGYDMQLHVERVRLTGSAHGVSCISWQDMRTMEEARGKLRPGSIDIDFDMLPVGPDDLDPARIAYARRIQSQYVELPEHVDDTPIEEWVERRQTEIARAAAALVLREVMTRESTAATQWLADMVQAGIPLSAGAIEACIDVQRETIQRAIDAAYALRRVIRVDDTYYRGGNAMAILDQLIGVSPVELAGRANMQPEALVAAMEEQGHRLNKYGYYPFEATLGFVPEAPPAPHYYQTMDKLLGAHAPDMNPAEARAFIGRHGGHIQIMRDSQGNAREYVADIAAGLLRHLNRRAHPPNTPRYDFLTSGQLAAQLGLPLHTVDERLPAARAKIVRRELTERRAAKSIPFIWCENQAGEVVPHYNPLLGDIIRDM